MLRSPRTLRRLIALAGSTALLASGGALVAVAPALAATSATGGSGGSGGSGSSLPYTEVQAETSATNGTVIGPSYTQGQLADEASQRKAVTLKGTGQYVTFTTPVATVQGSTDGSGFSRSSRRPTTPSTPRPATRSRSPSRRPVTGTCG